MITSYVTDIGGKSTNQDSLLIVHARAYSEQVVFAAVCDGMGGLQKGELASAVVIRAFDQWFMEEFPFLLQDGLSPESLFAAWNRIIQKSNMSLIDYGQKHNSQVGTTITGLLIYRNQYYIVNVGDSRIYEIADSGIQCLTKDHSFVMREVEEGRLRPEEMEHDSRRNILLQCIGVTGEVNPDFMVGNVSGKKVYMLCCDGFRHEITAKEFYENLKPSELIQEKMLQRRLEDLLSTNLQRGERDNITAVGIIVEKN